MKQPSKNYSDSASHGRLMNIEEAALTLGVSRAGLYRLVTAGEIRFVRLGRRVLIDPADLDALIVRCKGSTTDESAA
jgi:excisionase family DNA binding protein